MKTQRQRSDALRREYDVLFPKLDQLKLALRALLDEAQHAPPPGGADGTISPTQFGQLRGIEKRTQELLLSLLFNSR